MGLSCLVYTVVANTILVSGGLVEGPAYLLPAEEAPMAESTDVYPAYYYSPTCLAGRVFASQQEVTAARSEGPWTRSLTEAQEAAAQPAPAASAPAPDEGDEPHVRRSHR